MKRAVLLGALLCLPLACRGELALVLDITGGGLGPVPLSDAVFGWQFTAGRSITVVALGLWDQGADGLHISHTVGLWTIDRTLLRTATVDNTSIPVASAFAGGRWLFTEIAPVTLDPGSYVLGATFGNPIIGADEFLVGTPLTTSGVTYNGSRSKVLLPGPVLAFPDQGPGLGGLFGPNMAVAVPEPATFLLLAGVVIWMARPRSWIRGPRA